MAGRVLPVRPGSGVPPVRRAPSFAVALTVKNMREFLPDCLASLLPQLGDAGELVVVDACSTDGTTEYLRDLEARGKLRLIVTPCTTGRGRHLAILATEAPVLVTQVDADLRLAPGVLDRALSELSRHPRWGVLVVVGRQDRNPDSTKLYVWRREAYRASGGYPDRTVGEDLEVLRQPLRAGTAGHLELPAVGEDLRARSRPPSALASPWEKGPGMYQVALRRLRGGWDLTSYLRYLWVVRRGRLRFLAGAGLTLAAALALRLRPKDRARPPGTGGGASPGRSPPPPG
jgi:glycosyltransferase involved in cell wall biosynthesis